jgi:phospholipid/cholesterol/gamma-HCH transport system substrate-binding protein
MPRSQYWKAGLFVISAAVILVAAIAMLAGIHLSTPRNHYTIRFSESVSGLEPGGAVRYRGVQMGNVEEIRIPEEDITKVEVSISIKKGMPIKTDTKATVSSLGVTGIKFIELFAGSTEAPLLPPGSEIESEQSFLTSLTGMAATAGQKLDVLLANLIYITDRTKVDKLTEKLESVLGSVGESTGQVSDILTTVQKAAGNLDGLVVRIDGMLARNEGDIDSTLTNLAVTIKGLKRTMDELEESGLITHAGATAAASRDIADDVRSIMVTNRRSISETLANLREASANLNDFSRHVRDKPSLLLRSSSPRSPDLPGVD